MLVSDKDKRLAKRDSFSQGARRSGDATYGNSLLEHDHRVTSVVAEDSLELGGDCASMERTASPDGTREEQGSRNTCGRCGTWAERRGRRCSREGR